MIFTRLKNKNIIIGIIVIVVSFLISKVIAEGRAVPSSPNLKSAKAVFTKIVNNANIPIVIETTGELLSRDRIEIYSEVQGVFFNSDASFKSGQFYRKGQVLVGIDTSNQIAVVQSLRSKYYNLILSVLADLKIDFPDNAQRWEAYLKTFSFNSFVKKLPQLASKKENFFINSRGIPSAYYNLKNQENKLQKHTIRAPFDGVLTATFVSKRTLVRVGQRLGTFINTKAYEIKLSVNPDLVSHITIGKDVDFSTFGTDKKWQGQIIRINSIIDRNTQMVDVFVEIYGEELREGMYLQARIEGEKETDVVEVSRELLIQGSKIFIVRNDRLEYIKVNPVFYTQKTVLLKGIPENTEIVNKLIPGAYKGMVVKVFQGKDNISK